MHNKGCVLCKVEGEFEIVAPSLRDDDTNRFRIVRCLTCGHVQIAPLPTPEEDRVFYRDDQQTRSLTGPADMRVWERKAQEDTARRMEWLERLNHRHPHPESRAVLDVGCGYGFFVDVLGRRGYDAVGIDASAERLALARDHLEGRFIQGIIDSDFVAAHREAFGWVTLFHVLEHVADPVTFVKQCFELVQPGGWMLVEVPNLADELLDHSPEYRAFYWQRAHLSYFDAPHLSLVLRRAGVGRFRVRGVQRYGLRNLLNWLEVGCPQVESPDFRATQPLLRRLESIYRRDRVRAMTCDTVVAEATK